MSPIKKAFAVWIVSTLFICTFAYVALSSQLQREYANTQKDFSQIEGKVLTVTPEAHCSCSFEFSLDGQIYHRPGGSCCEFAPGSTLPVYVERSHPESAMTRAPRAVFLNDLLSLMLVIVVLPIVAAVMVSGKNPFRSFEAVGKWLILTIFPGVLLGKFLENIPWMIHSMIISLMITALVAWQIVRWDSRRTN